MNALRPAASTLVAALLLAAGREAAAQERYRGWDEIRDPSFVFDPDRRDFRNYQVGGAPQVRELLGKYERLVHERAVVPALRQLQELLDEHGASVVQVASERYLGAAEYARWLLLCAAPDVRAAYDRLAELNGRAALDRARVEHDLFALRSLARRFANARVGQEALLELARLHRERGARQVAAWHAHRLLDFLAVPAPGTEAQAAAFAEEARAIAGLAAGAGLAVDEPARAPDVWPTFGGDASRARPCVDPLHSLDVERAFLLPVEHPRFEGDRSPLAGMRHEPVEPIRVGDRLYVNNSLSVRCFDLLARTLLWEHEGTQARVRGRDEDGFLSVAEYDPRNDFDDPTWSKALVVGLSAGGRLVLANLQVPKAANVKMHQGFRINDPCRGRGIVALDAQDGSLRWEQRPLRLNTVTNRLEYAELRRRGDPDGVVPRLEVPAPPAIVDDVVFALGHFFEGAINTYLVALDLPSGEPLFTVPLVIGQQELSMFNMPFQEFTTGCPSFWDGTLFCPTHVGLIAAVDATFGDLRWLAAYDALRIVPPDNYFRNRPRPVYWDNRGPLAGDDLLLVTPHDSMQLLSLDPATGKERFSLELRRRDAAYYPTSHLIGVIGGRAIVATSGSVVAVELDGGRVSWQYPDATRAGARPIELLGTGAVTDRRIYLPTQDELVVLEERQDDDRQYRAVEVDRRSWDPEEPRSVLVFADMLVAAGKTSVLVAFDPAEALRELRRDVERQGESSDLLARIGGLERQAGELAPAAATLRRAIDFARREPAAPADLLRIRAMLCATLREIAAQEGKAGRKEQAEAALVEAESVADESEARAAIVRELLAGAASDARDERALKWLGRLRDDFGSIRVAVPELSPRPVTAAIWVGLELARRRERRGELEQALAELQRVQSDWPAEPLAERDSVAVSQAAVAALLERGPAALRERYDRDARSAFDAAARANDAERLALLLRRFPGAASAPEYAARELELLRASRRPVEALRIGAEILRSRASAALERSATVELARAARDVGNASLARALVRRLSIAPEGAVPDDLRSFTEWPEEPRPEGSRLEPAHDVALDENARILGSSDRPLRGEPLPRGFESLLVHVPGLDATILRIHLPDGERRWEASLPRPRQGVSILQTIHVASALVVRHGSALAAFDLDSGDELWRKELERDLVEMATASGVLLFTQETLSREGGEGVPVELTFLEPRTGQPLASLPLSGADSHAGQLVGSGSFCVASSNGRRGQSAEVFDAVSGARRLDPLGYSLGTPLLLARSELLIVPDSKPAPGELGTRQGGVQRLNAMQLGGGEKAFEVDLLPLSYKLKYLYPVAEGFAVHGGVPPNEAVLVVDPRTGVLVGAPTPLPKDLSMNATRALVVGEESLVRVVGFSDWRRGEPMSFVLLAGDGRELWRQSFELPKNTAQALLPNRLLRQGGSLVLGLQTMAAGNYRTEVLVLDEGSGAVLDREGFDGGRSGQRDELVKVDDFVALHQDRTLHVLAWR